MLIPPLWRIHSIGPFLSSPVTLPFFSAATSWTAPARKKMDSSFRGRLFFSSRITKRTKKGSWFEDFLFSWMCFPLAGHNPWDHNRLRSTQSTSVLRGPSCSTIGCYRTHRWIALLGTFLSWVYQFTSIVCWRLSSLSIKVATHPGIDADSGDSANHVQQWTVPTVEVTGFQTDHSVGFGHGFRDTFLVAVSPPESAKACRDRTKWRVEVLEPRSLVRIDSVNFTVTAWRNLKNGIQTLLDWKHGSSGIRPLRPVGTHFFGGPKTA